MCSDFVFILDCIFNFDGEYSMMCDMWTSDMFQAQTSYSPIVQDRETLMTVDKIQKS